MQLQLISLSGEKLNETVYEVVLPTASGEISVYPGHEPLVTVAVAGMVTVRRNKADDDAMRDVFAINGGVVEVSPSEIKVLVDEAEAPDDIVESEARAALQRAEELRDQAGSAVELEQAHQLIAQHSTRLKVAGLRRHHRH